MAQIVCIKLATAGLNYVGDIVSIHDDDVKLSGPGYTLADIVIVKGATAEELRTKLKALIPKQKRIFRTSAAANTWSDVRPEEKAAWQDKGGYWNFLEKPPKYMVNISSLTTDDRSALADAKTLVTDKESILLGKARDNISYDSSNLVKITELNPVVVTK